MAEQTLDISWKTIAKVFMAGFVLYILFLARHVIIWLFFAIIISLLLEPVINFLKRWRIPKVVAVILVYLSILGVIGLVVYLTAPIFIFEINQFIQNIPDYFEKINPLLRNLGIDVARSFNDLVSVLITDLQESSSGVARAISVFFGGFSSAIFIFTFAFFISLEEKAVEKVLLSLVPKKYEQTVLTIAHRSQFKVAGWFGVRILTCFFVGVASFIVLFLLGVKYAFILSLISGLLNFVPFVGPAITAIIVVLSVGASDSWLVAIYVLVALLVIQEVENKLITPLLTKKFLNFPPILVLLSLLVGGTIFGLLGMVFLVPIFGIVYEFLKEFLEKRKREESY